MQRKFLLAIALSAISLHSVAKVAPAPRDIAASVHLPNEKIILQNGLTVILSEDHTTPFVAVSLWYKVGAINEKSGRTGLAHLFEHLMFEGTRHIKPADHFKLLETAGAFDLNASTNFDRTNYYQTVPKNQLELALALESSRMFWLSIDQKRLDEQRAVVRREREQRFEATPYGNVSLKLWEAVFPPSHPFHGQVIGSHRDLEAANLADIKSFYDDHYGPSNATITLVGDFNKTDALALVGKYFGTLPKTKTMESPILPKIVLNGEEILREEEKLGKLPLIHIQYVTPGLLEPGDAEMDILAHILAGGEYGRLTKTITRDKPYASAVSAYQQSFGQVSVFTIDAVLNPGVDEATVRTDIDKVLADLGQKSFLPTEIERAKNSVLTQQLFGLQSLGGHSGRAELLQTYNQFALQPDYLKEDILRYRKVDEKALADAAKKYLPVGKARKILIAKPVSVTVAKKGN